MSHQRSNKRLVQSEIENVGDGTVFRLQHLDGVMVQGERLRDTALTVLDIADDPRAAATVRRESVPLLVTNENRSGLRKIEMMAAATMRSRPAGGRIP